MKHIHYFISICLLLTHISAQAALFFGEYLPYENFKKQYFAGYETQVDLLTNTLADVIRNNAESGITFYKPDTFDSLFDHTFNSKWFGFYYRPAGIDCDLSNDPKALEPVNCSFTSVELVFDLIPVDRMPHVVANQTAYEALGLPPEWLGYYFDKLLEAVNDGFIVEILVSLVMS